MKDDTARIVTVVLRTIAIGDHGHGDAIARVKGVGSEMWMKECEKREGREGTKRDLTRARRVTSLP